MREIIFPKKRSSKAPLTFRKEKQTLSILFYRMEFFVQNLRKKQIVNGMERQKNNTNNKKKENKKEKKEGKKNFRSVKFNL